MKFIEFRKPMFREVQEREVASDPNRWFEYLRRKGVVGLRLSYAERRDHNISDRMSAGFVGGGGTWAIEGVYRNSTRGYWRSRWEVWNQNAPERKIWKVTYGKLAEGQTATVAKPPRPELKGELLVALGEIHDFSRRHNCDGFTNCFAKAIETLSAPSLFQFGHHRDLAPKGTLTSDAVALLDACQTAWVFGAMGSWNDMGFDGKDGQTYDRVSENLFRLLTEAIPSATNDSFKAN